VDKKSRGDCVSTIATLIGYFRSLLQTHALETPLIRAGRGGETVFSSRTAVGRGEFMILLSQGDANFGGGVMWSA